jgi:3-methyl-2-oxobutanoate hydroxymethyltransferase
MIQQRFLKSLLKIKKSGVKIAGLTAYSANHASMMDSYVDFILVGDSLGMTLYGMADTTAVDMAMMIRHGECVVRATKRAVIIVDMPFASYQLSPAQAYENAVTLIRETGCHGIKIEVNEVTLPTIKFLSERGIPLVAHIGLIPQYVHTFGGYKVQGKTAIGAESLRHLAQQSIKAGAMVVLLESVVEQVAATITAESGLVPVIGIGASPDCDGQVLVSDDVFGYSQTMPKFAQKYANFNEMAEKAIKNYVSDVKRGKFPDKGLHCFH